MMHLLHAGSSLWSRSLCISDVSQLVFELRWKLQALARLSINSALSRSFDTRDYKLGWIKHTFWISHKILAVRRTQRFLKKRAREGNKKCVMQINREMGPANPIYAVAPFPSDAAAFISIFSTRMVFWDFSLWVHHWNTVKIICNNGKL